MKTFISHVPIFKLYWYVACSLMHQRWHYYTNQLPIIFHQVNNDKNQERKCGIYLILNVYNQMYLFYISLFRKYLFLPCG